ncbi:MAG: glycosyltransferase 4 family protein [Candidatus Bathyarchaeia archaeon]|jgi:UDP-N-acetylglucosamine--dolichyl-phosphate N-acetylglucosaminephosphotransferase
MYDYNLISYVSVVFLTTFAVTFLSTPVIARFMKSHGITGKDVHKIGGPEIPEMCGMAILFGLSVGATGYAILVPGSAREAMAFLGATLIAGSIGIVDDRHPLGPKTKPLLTAIACVPILLLGTYVPYPNLPLIGEARLTIVYPLLIPLAIAVTSNAVNMMDVMNGVMPGTVAIIATMLTGILIVAGEWKIAPLSAGLVAAMLALFYFNRFPAKVFSGDTGSLAVGAALGALAILGRMEMVVVIALMPQIMNAFYGLSSIGRLYERREIRQRPTKLLNDGRLAATAEKNAPITLARLILAAGPFTERNLVRGMMLLTVLSSILALLTYWMTVVRI